MWWLVFQALPVIAWGVAVLYAVRPLKLTRLASLLLSLVLAVAFGKFAVFALVGGNAFNPDLPQGVVWFCGWAYASAMMLTGLSTVAALADWALRIARRPMSAHVKRIRTAALAVFAAAISLWGMYEGIRVPSVKRVEIAYGDLPPAFDGYRIVHLSDLHCSTAARRWRIERIVERVNALDADLIAITGDFVDGTPGERGDDLEPLADLKAKDGVWGCTGNHEAYWNWYGWADLFRRWDVRILSESTFYPKSVIRRGNASIALGGLDDQAFRRGDAWDGMPLPMASLAFSPVNNVPPDAFRILLYHRPLTAAIGAEAAGVRLQLSGHTHGGAMPGVSWLVARFNEGHVRGLYEFAPGRFLHVSPGTGQWAGFPLRLFNPAEITEIVLRSGQRAEELRETLLCLNAQGAGEQGNCVLLGFGVVARSGIEPLTHGFSVRCSTN